jgi:hypothetical protein
LMSKELVDFLGVDEAYAKEFLGQMTALSLRIQTSGDRSNESAMNEIIRSARQNKWSVNQIVFVTAFVFSRVIKA